MELEIIYNESSTHEGNDCLITSSAIVAIEPDTRRYIVVKTRSYRGWGSQDFEDYTESVDNRGLALQRAREWVKYN